MTAYIEHTGTGERVYSFRSFGEVVSQAFLILGHSAHVTYSTAFKCSQCRDSGVWIWEEDSNGQIIEGIKP